MNRLVFLAVIALGATAVTAQTYPAGYDTWEKYEFRCEGTSAVIGEPLKAPAKGQPTKVLTLLANQESIAIITYARSGVVELQLKKDGGEWTMYPDPSWGLIKEELKGALIFWGGATDEEVRRCAAAVKMMRR